MILFNNEHTHAVLSFVASGHVVIFDAETRTPLNCFETTVGSTGTRQAHAAYPAPDGSFILVANQNGKRLERIDTNFATNTFTHNPAATLDLMTCTTPSGQPCEHPDAAADQLADLPDRRFEQPLRLRHAARRRPLRRQRQDHADGHRRRVRQVDGERERVRRRSRWRRHMYINSGGSPVNVSRRDPHHPALYGFDVYRFPLRGYSSANAPNTPAPDAAAVEERDVGFARRRGDRREPLPLGAWIGTPTSPRSSTSGPASG